MRRKCYFWTKLDIFFSIFDFVTNIFILHFKKYEMINLTIVLVSFHFFLLLEIRLRILESLLDWMFIMIQIMDFILKVFCMISFVILITISELMFSFL